MHADLHLSLTLNINILTKAAGLTLEQLMERTSLGQRLSRPATLDVRDLQKIANALNISLTTLIDDVVYEPTNTALYDRLDQLQGGDEVLYVQSSEVSRATFKESFEVEGWTYFKLVKEGAQDATLAVALKDGVMKTLHADHDGERWFWTVDKTQENIKDLLLP